METDAIAKALCCEEPSLRQRDTANCSSGFEGSQYLYLQSQTAQAGDQLLLPCSDLKMKVLDPSKHQEHLIQQHSSTFQKIASLNQHCCENLRSQTVCSLCNTVWRTKSKTQ
jgi:hypothetical protein